MADQANDFSIPCLDDPNAPVVFATELTGCGAVQDNCHLTFAVAQYDHSVTPPRVYRRTCLRLVLPMMAAAGVSQFLGAKLQEGAAEPLPVPAAGKLN